MINFSCGVGLNRLRTPANRFTIRCSPACSEGENPSLQDIPVAPMVAVIVLHSLYRLGKRLLANPGPGEGQVLAGVVL